MRDFYRPEEHGPFKTVPLNGHLCILKGNYVLCPSLDLDGDEPTCAVFNCGLEPGWKCTMNGLMADPRPVHIPRRCKPCKKANPQVQLVVLQIGYKGEATDQGTPEDPESASPEE